jgi:hypothetical protein
MYYRLKAARVVLAKELAELGRKVVMLEKGGYYEGKNMNLSILEFHSLFPFLSTTAIYR